MSTRPTSSRPRLKPRQPLPALSSSYNTHASLETAAPVMSTAGGRRGGALARPLASGGHGHATHGWVAVQSQYQSPKSPFTVTMRKNDMLTPRVRRGACEREKQADGVLLAYK